MQCPQCSNDIEFDVFAVIHTTLRIQKFESNYEVFDEQNESGPDWNLESTCKCLQCQHEGPFRTFNPTPDLLPIQFDTTE
jgi:hypothetical protein